MFETPTKDYELQASLGNQTANMAEGFTEAQKADAQETFDLFDKDENGKISAEEIATLVRSLGQNPTEAELDEIRKAADKENSGYVAFDDFIDAAGAYARSDPEEDLTKALKVLDPEETGYVDADDLYESLGSMGDKLSEDEKGDLMETAKSLNVEGKIKIDDFVKLLTSGAS